MRQKTRKSQLDNLQRSHPDQLSYTGLDAAKLPEDDLLGSHSVGDRSIRAFDRFQHRVEALGEIVEYVIVVS
jgi:hypothetical protein